MANKKYPKQVEEYIKTRLESIDNVMALSREVKLNFGLDNSVEAIRYKIKTIQDNLKVEKRKKGYKRLFFDIETSYLLCRMWRVGKVNWVSHHQIVQDKKIICISYKWEGEDKIHTLVWDKRQNDKKLIKEFIKVLGQADEIIAHNGDRFDIKEIRTRAIKEGLLMFPRYRTLDTLKKSRKYFNFHSNKLDYLGEYLEVGRKQEHDGFQLWIDVVEGKNKDRLDEMVRYCEQDVILLEDVFSVLSPYIDHNTNFAMVSGGEKYHCPNCASKNTKLSHTDTTPMGYIKRNMKCLDCKKQFVISNKSYVNYLKDQYKLSSK